MKSGRMRSFRLLPLLLSTAGLVGCGEEPTVPQESLEIRTATYTGFVNYDGGFLPDAHDSYDLRVDIRRSGNVITGEWTETRPWGDYIQTFSGALDTLDQTVRFRFAQPSPYLGVSARFEWANSGNHAFSGEASEPCCDVSALSFWTEAPWESVLVPGEGLGLVPWWVGRRMIDLRGSNSPPD